MTSSSNKTLERIASRVPIPEPAYERLLRRRDRKRRNQRSAAGAVGIAVFVAAIWTVTSGGPVDRTQQPVVPGRGTKAPVQTVGPVPETDYVLDLNTGEMTPLPASIGGGPHAWGYAASPDGSRLAYTDRGDNGRAQIFIANPDGTGIEQMTHDLEAAFSPAWSPDGSKIAYIGNHDDRLSDLFVLDLATGESTQLTFATREPDPAKPDRSPWKAFLPSFTPDGTSIMYVAGREGSVYGEYEVRMIPLTGGKSVRLMQGIWEPYLSPDGSLVAYSCPGGPPTGVCLANVDGSGERVLVQGGLDAIRTMRWSPDGTRIAYWEFHQADVSIVDVATGQATHVAEGYWPTWLDDDTLIIEMDDCYDPVTEARLMTGCG